MRFVPDGPGSYRKYGNATAEEIKQASLEKWLPAKYNVNSDGSITGPGTGKAWNTNILDSEGNPIFRRDNGSGYYSISQNGIQNPIDSPYTSGAPSIHHICTNKNCTGTKNGGPWTPVFREFFKNAGLDIDGELNKVAIDGHRGPHPADYHRYVFQQLSRNLEDIAPGTSQYKSILENTLKEIAQEAITPGHQVNAWLTKGK